MRHIVLVTALAIVTAGSALAQTPSISTISPNPAAIGATVTITGTNFGASQGSSTVTFAGVSYAISSWSATKLVGTIPTNSSPDSGPVVVTVGGVSSNSVSLSVVADASISSISPNPVASGGKVTIAGTNFGATQGASTLTFNGTSYAVNTWSNTAITATVPSTGATSGSVAVNVGGVSSNSQSLTINAAPAVSGLSPSQGPPQVGFVISGTNLGSSGTVTIGGAPATTSNWSATSVIAQVPSGTATGSAAVVVTSADGGVVNTSFLVTTPLGCSQ